LGVVPWLPGNRATVIAKEQESMIDGVFHLEFFRTLSVPK
jgi:hypothetical protein